MPCIRQSTPVADRTRLEFAVPDLESSVQHIRPIGRAFDHLDEHGYPLLLDVHRTFDDTLGAHKCQGFIGRLMSAMTPDATTSADDDDAHPRPGRAGRDDHFCESGRPATPSGLPTQPDQSRISPSNTTGRRRACGSTSAEGAASRTAHRHYPRPTWRSAHRQGRARSSSCPPTSRQPLFEKAAKRTVSFDALRHRAWLGAGQDRPQPRVDRTFRNPENPFRGQPIALTRTVFYRPDRGRGLQNTW